MDELSETQEDRSDKLFYLFVSLSVIAYLSRIAELFPLLTRFRFTLVLFSITFLLFFMSGAYRNIRLRQNRELQMLIAFIFCGYLSVPFSVWPSEALRNTNNLLMINLPVFIYFQAILTSRERLHGAIFIILLSSLFLVIGVILKPSIVEGNRLTATQTYDPNDIALIFAFSFPLAVSYFVTSKKFIAKLFSLMMIGFLIFGLMKTSSRGGLLAFGVALTLILLSSKIQLRLFYKIVIIVTAVAFLSSPQGQSLRNRFSTLLSGKDYNITTSDTKSSGRLAIWKSGLQIFSQHPFFGVGTGTSYVAMGKKWGDNNWRTMHNSYLQVAVELGAFGFLAYIIILLKIIRNCDLIRGIENDPTLSHSASIKICLFSFMVAAFFLSQAFSILISVALALSSRLSYMNHVHQSNRLYPTLEM